MPVRTLIHGSVLEGLSRLAPPAAPAKVRLIATCDNAVTVFVTGAFVRSRGDVT